MYNSLSEQMELTDCEWEKQHASAFWFWFQIYSLFIVFAIRWDKNNKLPNPVLQFLPQNIKFCLFLTWKFRRFLCRHDVCAPPHDKIYFKIFANLMHLKLNVQAPSKKIPFKISWKISAIAEDLSAFLIKKRIVNHAMDRW